MYRKRKIYPIVALCLLSVLILSGCQNANTTTPATPSVSVASSTQTPQTPDIGTFEYAPMFVSFENLETMGVAMKGYELNDVVKNDPRFTEEEKAAIEHIQKTKGHNSFFFDVPMIKDGTEFTVNKEVRLIYSSDIKAGSGVEEDADCKVGYTIADATYRYDFDVHGNFIYDRHPEYTSTIKGTVLTDSEEAIVILLGSNGMDTAKVYDVYLKRRNHIRVVSDAPTERVLALVESIKEIDAYWYDDVVGCDQAE